MREERKRTPRVPSHQTDHVAAPRVEPQTPANDASQARPPPETVSSSVLGDAGQPLDSTTRTEFEHRFGHDFSRVRIYADERAAEAAQAVNARAFAFGQRIVFGARAYAPDTTPGQNLLAHELAHTIQTDAAPASGVPTTTSHPGDLMEREATAAAQAVSAGEQPVVTGRAGPGVLFRSNGDDLDAAFTEYSAPPGQRSRGPLQEPLSPDEMYRNLTSRTAFREGVKEERLLRHGNATRALVQIVDADGNRVAVAFGRNDGKVHAEEDALRQLRRQVAGQRDQLRGGRLVVVVNQHVCTGRCVPALRSFAEDFGMQRVDSHVYVRQALRGNRQAGPRTTFATQTSPGVEGHDLQRVDRNIYQGTPPPATEPHGGAGGGSGGRLPAAGRQSGGSRRTSVGTRLRRAGGGAMRGIRRGVGGRGIAVLIGLAAGYIAGMAHASREQRQYEYYAGLIDEQIASDLERLESRAIALKVRDGGVPVYANISITETENTYIIGWAENIETVTTLDSLTLDYVEISTEFIAAPESPRRSHRTWGSMMGSGVYDSSTQEYSIPLEIDDILTPYELTEEISQLDAEIADDSTSGFELQYLLAERNILLEMHTVYAELAGATGNDDLERLGAQVRPLHDRWHSMQELQAIMVPGETYSAEMVTDIDQALASGVVPDVEAQMLEEERRAIQLVVESELELSSRMFTEEELYARSEALLEQRQRAAEATSRSAEQSASGFDPSQRIREIDEQTGWMSLMPDHLARLQRERAILVEIRAIDEELSSANFLEHTLRQKLQDRDRWLAELHALYAEAA